MCTVSYIPTDSGFIFTSNRDERKNRKTSTRVVSLSIGSETIHFPKDLEAGGTWIANSENRSLCLLNGAFEPHIRKESYKKSRGLVLLDTYNFNNTVDFISNYDFRGIEPFTLIIITHTSEIRLEKIVWDENEIHYFDLNPKEPYLWCSVPLYGPLELVSRKKIFERFLQNKKSISIDGMMLFHSNTKSDETMLYDNGEKATVSITQISHAKSKTTLNYYDLFSDGEVF